MSAMKTAHCWAIISCQGNLGRGGGGGVSERRVGGAVVRVGGAVVRRVGGSVVKVGVVG